jgi:hypothetical protein
MSKSKEYKDGMFRTIFNTEEKALRLYSAVSGKTFSRDTEVKIMTLDNVFLSKQRNDLLFTVNGVLVVIIEHQSTLNPNIPLRLLQYLMLFYEIFSAVKNALYKEKLIKLPKPEFYMLYNGPKPYPPSGVLKLSDAFEGMEEGEVPNLELTVTVININAASNTAVLDQNEDLKGYAVFVEKVNKRKANGETLAEAVKHAMEECIREGILVEFFKKYKDEVNSMFSLVYDDKTAMEIAKEEAFEDGIEVGQVEGKAYMLAEQLSAKFGLAEEVCRSIISKFTSEQLDAVGRNIFKLDSIDDVKRFLAVS